MAGAGSHLWIRRVTFSGGFLDGLELQLSPGLNCLIGARGAGKTTVLEAIRFALDRLPDPVKAKDRRKQIDRLLESNLGSVSLEVVSADGACYRIERRVGEAPAVFDGSGERLQVDLSRDAVLGLDGHSQSEIESIAGDAYLQLRLIDARAAADLRGVEDELAHVEGDLRRVAEEVCRTRRHVADLAQETRDLPEVESRLAELSVQGSDERADRLRHEQELKTLRDSEQRQLERLGRAARQGLEAIEAARARLGVDLRAIEADAPGRVPNLDLLDTVQRWAQEGLGEGLRGLEAAQRSLALLSEQVARAGQDLAARHSAQERGYEQALAASQGDPGKARERARLASRREELLRRRADQDRSQAALEQAVSRRAELRLRLADLRQRRLGLRQRMAEELNELLGPAVRVTIEPQGNTDEYAELLRSALKGTGTKGGTSADLVISRGVPPSELLTMLESDDQLLLRRRLGIDADRAGRILLLLREDPTACALETVDLHDRPVIELQDGERYKPTSSLSTGQRCTAILPILLHESERPLLIDQPEDNLDNSYVTKLVSSIRAVARGRQLLFATHNPNLPVLGEAPRVLVLASNGATAWLEGQGNVEEVRAHVEGVLEGGKEAFLLRMQRYGY